MVLSSLLFFCNPLTYRRNCLGMMQSILFLLAPVLSGLERVLELVITAYDVVLYGPLQRSLSPLVAKIPRKYVIFGQSCDIFTANNVTFARTLLLVPIGFCLKYGYGTTACGLVVWQDFLDDLDGAVARTQKKVYGDHIDDSLLGDYLDAICDKVVFVFVMAAICMVAPLHHMTTVQSAIFVGISSILVAYEVVLGVVQTTDYFTAHFYRQCHGNVPPSSGIAAPLVGKLKEKFIAMSQALLCVVVVTGNPMNTKAGIVAMVALSLSIWFSHKGIQHKLYMRKLSRADNANHNGRVPTSPHSLTADHDSLTRKQQQQQQQHQEKVDRLYTVGCFDMFHQGHINILTKMRQLGKQVIVGVHSDESMQLLKNLTPTDSLTTRMTNVKKHADQVFVVWGTDPSTYIKCAFHVEPGETALYARGDDMPDFPGRDICEEVMPVKLLPYTQGVSSRSMLS